MKINRVTTSTHVKTIHYERSQGTRAITFAGIGLTFLFLAAFLLIGILGINEKAAAAIQPDGFVCDGTFFNTRYDAGNGTTLLKIDRSTSPYTTTVVAALTTGNDFMNGLGYNPIDGYLYEWYRGGNQIAMINNVGDVTLRTVAGMPNTNVTAATVDKNGIYYGVKDVASGFTALEYFTIDLNQPTLSAVNHSLTGVGNNAPAIFTNSPGDLVVDPADTSSIYINMQSKLLRIDLLAGTIEYVNFSNNLLNSFGSMFVDAAGTMYGYASGGGFYQINKNTGTSVLIETGTTAAASDGASCANSLTAIDTTKALSGSPQAINATTFSLTYILKVANTTGYGTVVPNVQLTENLTRAFSAGNPIISVPVAPTLSGGGCALNGSFDGTSDTRLLTGTGSLADGTSCTITFTVRLVYPSVGAVPSASQLNTVYASTSSRAQNNGYTFTSSGDPTPPIDLLSADESTNATDTPALPHGDIPSPTGVLFASAVEPSVEAPITQNVAGVPGAPEAGFAVNTAPSKQFLIGAGLLISAVLLCAATRNYSALKK